MPAWQQGGGDQGGHSVQGGQPGPGISHRRVADCNYRFTDSLSTLENVLQEYIGPRVNHILYLFIILSYSYFF